MVDTKSKKFKKTELGSIPEDWDIFTVEDLVKNGFIEKPLDGNHGSLHPKGSDFTTAGIPFIMANDIHDGQVDLEKCHFIKKEQADKLQKGFSFSGDVLLTHKGTIGNVAIVEKLTTKYIMLTPQVTYYRVKNPSSLNNKYIKQYFLSDYFQKYIKNISIGATRAYIGITQQRKLPFIFPVSVFEQTAIATALNDADNLISELEKLIAKKKMIKQGAMQELLKPKEGWEDKIISEIAHLYQPETISQEKFTKEGYLVYGANGIIGKYSKYNHKEWQTIITCRGSTCGTINKTKDKCWITGNAMVANVDNNESINKLFFYYLLSKQDFSNCITGSGQPQIVRKPLAEYLVRIPKKKSEQELIANLLSDMDSEIESLEKKLDKYKMIKQGMMQNLLTGKIRLV